MRDQDVLLSIGRFAEMTELTVRPLRLHVRLGSRVPTAGDYASGYRYDAEAQVEDRHRIHMLRALTPPVPKVQEMSNGDERCRTNHLSNLRVTQPEQQSEQQQALVPSSGRWLSSRFWTSIHLTSHFQCELLSL
jgi:DNA-binding transcriptional MerR regulator